MNFCNRALIIVSLGLGSFKGVSQESTVAQKTRCSTSRKKWNISTDDVLLNWFHCPDTRSSKPSPVVHKLGSAFTKTRATKACRDTQKFYASNIITSNPRTSIAGTTS